jgi:hypothetical protein
MPSVAGAHADVAQRLQFSCNLPQRPTVPFGRPAVQALRCKDQRGVTLREGLATLTLAISLPKALTGSTELGDCSAAFRAALPHLRKLTIGEASASAERRLLRSPLAPC